MMKNKTASKNIVEAKNEMTLSYLVKGDNLIDLIFGLSYSLAAGVSKAGRIGK